MRTTLVLRPGLGGKWEPNLVLLCSAQATEMQMLVAARHQPGQARGRGQICLIGAQWPVVPYAGPGLVTLRGRRCQERGVTR